MGTESKPFCITYAKVQTEIANRYKINSLFPSIYIQLRTIKKPKWVPLEIKGVLTRQHFVLPAKYLCPHYCPLAPYY